MLRATFRSLLARKLRLLLSGLAVVLGVSFVSGSFVLTDTMGKVFDDLFSSVSEKTDVVVRGAPRTAGSDARDPVPTSLVTTVRAVDGVAAASPSIEGYAQVVGKDGKTYPTGGAPSLGFNWEPDERISAFTLRQGGGPDRPDEIAIDAATARATGYGIGDRAPMLTREGRSDYSIVGIFGFGANDNLAGASVIAVDPAVAPTLLGRPGELTQIDLAAESGLSETQLRDRVAAGLPGGVEAVTAAQAADETAGDIQEGLGFFNTFLLVFAAVSLFVGAFIIFNTFSMLVAQRSRELALLRAIGASRGQVVRSVLVEAVVVGLIASAIGLAVGVGVALLLRWLVNLVAEGALPSGPLVIAPRTVVVSFVVGTLVTALAALLPARKASKVAPVEAMRDAATGDISLRRTTLVGGVLLLAGIGLMVPGLDGNLPVLGVAAVLVFLGVAGLSPLVSRPVTRLLGAPLARGVPGRLGRGNAMRNPRRTATTAAALMIGMALVSGVSVLGSSLKTSVQSVVEDSFGATFVVQDESFQGFSPALGESLAAAPGVDRVDPLAFDAVRIGGKEEFPTAIPAGAVGTSLKLEAAAGDLEALGPGGLLVAKSVADRERYTVGQRLPVETARGAPSEVTVTGIYENNALAGDYLIDLGVASGFTTQLQQLLLVRADPGADLTAVRAAVDRAAAAYPNATVQDQSQFVAGQAAQVDIVLNIITVLLVLSVLIAVLGIVNTLALSVIERTRELGLLRAVGLGRRQTRRMIRVESVIVAVFGAALGLVVGSALGVAVVRALRDVGVTELSFPLGRLGIYVVVAALAGVLAAILPARRAARLNVLDAIATT